MKLQITNYKLQISSAILFFSLLNFSFAQTARDTGKYSFSLQQAIDFAMKNQTQMQNAAYDEQSAQYKVKEAFGMGLPQINGSATANDFVEIPTQVIPAKAFNPKAGPDDLLAVKFGLQYSSTAGIDASQLLFNSDYIVGLQATKTYLELSRKATQRTKIDVSVAVTKAYYSVLVSDERMKLIDANIARIKTLMETTKALNENGVAEKIDLDRVTVTYNNLLVEKEKVQRLLQLGIVLLKFQIGMDQPATLALTDKLADIKFTSEISPDKFDYGKRVEYSLLLTQKNISQLMIKRNQMHYLPTAVLFGSASANAYRTKFDFFDTKKGWYPTIIVGAKINVGIFDGFQNHYRIQESKIDLLKAENNLKMVQQSIDLEISSAKTNLQNASATLETQKKNIELAESVYKTSKTKYEQGVGSNLEVMTAQTSLTEAQTNYYNALYDALVSKVDYDKANGNIK